MKDDDYLEVHELASFEEEIFGNITAEDVHFPTDVAEVREPMSLFWQDKQKQSLRWMDVDQSDADIVSEGELDNLLREAALNAAKAD